MIRNIKALGLAFTAVAVMSVVVVSAAEATQLHATASPTAVITGEQTNPPGDIFKLTGSGAETKCQVAKFEGTIEGGQAGQTTADELTVTPTYSGCKTAGLNSQVLMNGCKYTITGTHNGQTLSKTAWVDVVGCTTGKSIEIKLTGCTVTVPQQTTISHLTFHQQGTLGQSQEDVKVTVTAQGIQYEFHGIACPGPTPGPTQLASDGDYTGESTFKAYADLGTDQVTKHSHEYTEHTDNGVQVGLTVT